MQQNYAASLALVLKSEGGFVNDPRDPGGATNMGITLRTLAIWRHVAPYWKLPVSAVQTLSQSEASAIYKAQYWDAVRGDDLPAGIDYCVFDEAVNSGVVRAIKDMQSALGVTADGHIGLITLDALKRANPSYVISTICAKRVGFLRQLKTWLTFGKGWTNRVAAVRSAALAMAK